MNVKKALKHRVFRDKQHKKYIIQSTVNGADNKKKNTKYKIQKYKNQTSFKQS